MSEKINIIKFPVQRLINEVANMLLIELILATSP